MQTLALVMHSLIKKGISDKINVQNWQYGQKHAIKYSKTTKNKPGGVAAVLHRAFYYILIFKMRDAVCVRLSIFYVAVSSQPVSHTRRSTGNPSR